MMGCQQKTSPVNQINGLPEKFELVARAELVSAKQE